MKLHDHPTVLALKARLPKRLPLASNPLLDAVWLREVVLAAGAGDVGFVALTRPEIADQRADILRAFPSARSLVSFVVPMNRESIRSPARSVANLEFHHTGDEVNDIARRVLLTLEQHGARGINPAMGFPMEMGQFPGKVWVVSHKPVAVAAGLGQIGIHRNLIHPKFGNFVLLGTLIVDADISTEGEPIDFNPCLECKLCVAACPVGAIKPDGAFDFSACYNHNYREFMGGFTGWVEEIADSKNAHDYRRRVSDSESASMWQSLSFGANYKAAYCLAVCPAGEDVIGPYLDSKKQHKDQVVKPLLDKVEPVYVVRHSDAEAHLEKRFAHKTKRVINSGLRPSSARGFLAGMPMVFQRGAAKGLDATYHFRFQGAEQLDATVVIRDSKLKVQQGLHGEPNTTVIADAQTWVGFVRRERNLLWAILTRRIRVRGSVQLLKAFQRCFPS